ncbi:MAG: SH3 domain-containing protein [Myxococcaceae bacterium]
MKVHSIVLTAVTALLAACGQPVADDSPSVGAKSGLTRLPPGASLQTTEAVNVRTGPNSSASVVTVLDEGTVVVSATGVVTGNWVQITVNGAEGWVFAPYVSPPACLELARAAQQLVSSAVQCSGLPGITIPGSDRLSCEASVSACTVSELRELLSVAQCQTQAAVCRNPGDTARLVQELYACSANINVSPACMNGF